MSEIDLIIILIFIVSMFFGFRKGLFLTLSSLVSFLVSVFAANYYYRDFADFLKEKTGLYESLIGFISGHEIGNKIGTDTVNGDLVGNLPLGAREYINDILADGFMEPILNEIHNTIAAVLLNIISFIIIFITVRILFSFIIRFINRATRLPVLNLLNRIGGMFIGIIQGVIISTILSTIIYTVALLGFNENLVNILDNSILVSYFYIGYIFF